MKYQLSIRTGKSGDKNSAATKAVLDCSMLLSSRDYIDYSLVLPENTGKLSYYFSIFKTLVAFYLQLEKNALVAVQYPMLNNVFKYFIKAGKRKSALFFCIVHDIESLRLGATDAGAVAQEAGNLSHYDCLVVHNSKMMQWLKENGCTTRMISLGVFDYLSGYSPADAVEPRSRTIAFAGNLTKSAFIYGLHQVAGWSFNVYGPNFKPAEVKDQRLQWCGEFSPEEVVKQLQGDYGLIWDGQTINECDKILGNYLRYNNPHKLSLYLAAGLPVIAPSNAAIAGFIKERNLGILVEDLRELETLEMTDAAYVAMKRNVHEVGKDIRKGINFLKALETVEAVLLS